MISSADISVVIPAYNAQSFIADALESIALQTALPREVIVIDDGSRDSTSDVVKTWIARRRPAFEVCLHQQTNGGIASARNSGMARSSGGWIALLDADDIWDALHIAQLCAGLAHVPTALLAYGAGRLFSDTHVQELPYDDFWDNPSKKFGTQIKETEFYKVDRKAFPRLVKGNFIKPSSLMFRREVLQSVGNFREVLGTAEDREFLARILLAGDFVYCSTPITRYRWHEDNASQSKNAKRNLGFGLQAIQIILREQGGKLTAFEMAACKQSMREAGMEYLYVCAREGLTAYWQGLVFVHGLLGRHATWSCMRLKHWPGGLYRTVRKFV